MSKPAALGIDVGGTKTLCVLVNKHYETIHAIKFKTAPHDGRKQFAKRLLHATKALKKIASAKGFEVMGIGIGWAGSIDHKRGRIKSSPNMVSLEDYPIANALKEALEIEAVRCNDDQ